MILTIKNELLQKMQTLFDRNEMAQGIPNNFLMDKKEFGLLLLEVQLAHDLKIELPIMFRNPNMDDKVHHSIQLEIYRTKFNNKSINEMINNWITGKYEASFRGVPIKYQSPKTKKKENAKKWQG